MRHMHHEVRVEAPVEHVWAFYCDTSRWPEWLPRGEFTDFTGLLKDLMIRGMVERQHRKILAGFKALAEAKVPAHA